MSGGSASYGKCIRLRFFSFRIVINSKGIDIGNGSRGCFLFHPFTKYFSFKQYLSVYTWVIKGKYNKRKINDNP